MRSVRPRTFLGAEAEDIGQQRTTGPSGKLTGSQLPLSSPRLLPSLPPPRSSSSSEQWLDEKVGKFPHPEFSTVCQPACLVHPAAPSPPGSPVSSLDAQSPPFPPAHRNSRLVLSDSFMLPLVAHPGEGGIVKQSPDPALLPHALAAHGAVGNRGFGKRHTCQAS